MLPVMEQISGALGLWQRSPTLLPCQAQQLLPILQAISRKHMKTSLRKNKKRQTLIDIHSQVKSRDSSEIWGSRIWNWGKEKPEDWIHFGDKKIDCVYSGRPEKFWAGANVQWAQLRKRIVSSWNCFKGGSSTTTKTKCTIQCRWCQLGS